jgi:hypothetical protein
LKHGSVVAGAEIHASPRLPYLIYALYALVNIAYALSRGPMPRPELFPVKKVVGFDQEMIDAIDKWRAKQKPLPNVSEAIRRLVELGLKAKK